MVKERLDQLSFSMNSFILSYGRYLIACEGFIGAQRYLTLEFRDFKVLARALWKLPRLTELEIDYRNTSIGAGEIMRNFKFLSGHELSFEGEYSLPVLFRALGEARPRIQKMYFGFGCDAWDAKAYRSQSPSLAYTQQAAALFFNDRSVSADGQSYESRCHRRCFGPLGLQRVLLRSECTEVRISGTRR